MSRLTTCFSSITSCQWTGFVRRRNCSSSWSESCYNDVAPRRKTATAVFSDSKRLPFGQRVGAGLLAVFLSVQAPCMPLLANPPPVIDREHEIVAEVLALVRNYFVDPTYHGVDLDNLSDRLMTKRLSSRFETYRTIRSTLAELGDGYTRLLTPEDMQSLRKFDVSGVGLMLTANSRGELVVASEPLKSTSAGQSGIRRGTIVTSIDGAPLAGHGAFEAAQLMQGEEGSTMKVGVRDADGSHPREVVLTRSYSQSGGAKVSWSLEDVNGRKVGYVRLPDFSAGSRGEVERALRELDSGGAKAYVLDLRHNPGGIFEGALEIAGLFEGRDKVVARVESRAQKDEVFRSRLVNGTGTEGSRYVGGAVVDPDAPLAVLVDGLSASASEVLAGSLRDGCRGVIAGNPSGRSFGKGLIQGVFGLSDGGGVVLTVARYRTPDGSEIQGKGVRPLVEFGGADGFFGGGWRWWWSGRAFQGQKGVAAGIDFREVESQLDQCKASASVSESGSGESGV